MKKATIASNKFKDGYNCAQSVLYSYHEKLGISPNMALKLSNGFGGGMGKMQKTCGAISGAIIAINLIYGRGENEDKSKQEITYIKVQELIRKFEEKYSTTNCAELLDNCDLSTVTGQKKFKDENMIESCYEYVEQAVTILDTIID